MVAFYAKNWITELPTKQMLYEAIYPRKLNNKYEFLLNKKYNVVSRGHSFSTKTTINKKKSHKGQTV